MSWRRGLVVFGLVTSSFVFADDQALWQEYGLVHSAITRDGRLTTTSYQMKDPTGALAAWEWLRSPNGHTCDLAAFCNQDGKRTVVADANYLLTLDGPAPTKEGVAALLKALPNRRDTSLPAILSFLPHQGLVPNSARYILGPSSLAAFAPELTSAHPGFDSSAEAQIAEYHVDKTAGKATKATRLALFYYATPGMARQHAASFKSLPNVQVKRSGVLVALVLVPESQASADTLLSRVQYEAKVTWNESPPPSPIKPLYRLLVDILYISCLLSALALAAGLIYAAMRVYRRRYGTLDADEAMTTLNLSGD